MKKVMKGQHVINAAAASNLLMAQQLLQTKTKFKKEFSAFSKNSTYFANNFASLRKKHGVKYIAIREGHVCSKSNSLSELLEKVEKKYPGAKDVYINYTGLERMNLLLY